MKNKGHKLKILHTAIFLNVLILNVFPDEGMWIPMLIEKYNIGDMQEKGLKLTAEDIYSVNQACLVNAVVLFGQGCTGEVISKDGLLLTNYHCAHGMIQNHSSVEKDYLTTGYWSYTRDKELPNPGLSVSFLKYMEDVTDKVLEGTELFRDTELIQSVIKKNIMQITSKATRDNHYKAEVNSFFYGRNYYLSVYEVFKDVRLVGAPPTSIGKFGGETDNWVWPRHSGDFALFRIYADSLNRPADYSPDNIPYKPVRHLDISLKGIKEGDFTMVLGYPANTEQFLVSDEIKLLYEKSLPKKIEVRETRLQIMDDAMQKNDTVRIKYSDKYASVSNAWKKWIGVVNGFRNFDVISKKEQEELLFQEWLGQNDGYNVKYGQLMSEFKNTYNEIGNYYVANDFGYEAIMGSEIVGFISNFLVLYSLDVNNEDESKKIINGLKRRTVNFFKEYELDIDRQIFPRMLELYYKNVDQQFHPEFYNELISKYKSNYDAYADYLFEKSIFTKKDKLIELLDSYSKKKEKIIVNDPLFKVFQDFGRMFYFNVSPQYEFLSKRIDSLYSRYVEALFLMYPDSVFYPDANFTMRLTYGNVKSYSPADAVNYSYYTTLKGAMEKENTHTYDNKIPEKLKDLYYKKDFDVYGQDSVMWLGFIATNHTSGGNSGSPVLNAEGQLIGINFDRNWEGTMSDYNYDLAVCRNITLDIRYVLFIIDKFAGATNIIEELSIVE